MTDNFQIVVNSTLLREFPKNIFLLYYARFYYKSDEDLTNEGVIQNNIKDLLDWDANGDSGLEIFCSKFESLKRRDLKTLTDYIINKAEEIKKKAKEPIKLRELEHYKVIRSEQEKQEEKIKEHFCDENYEANPYGKPAKVTIYEGRVYKSRQECMYKEGLTKNQLYQYLKKHESKTTS